MRAERLGAATPSSEEQSTTVPELAFRDGIMDRIRMREQRFDERAYLFVLGALEFCQQRLPERRRGVNGGGRQPRRRPGAVWGPGRSGTTPSPGRG